MTYQKAASADELKDGEMKKAILKDNVVLLVRLGGTFYALDNKCPHMGGSLADGTLDGASVVCPRHGTAFDVRTGAVAKNGKLAFIPVKPASARTYPVKVEGGDVLVGID
ncbi:MAG: Rieske 2Fe-2S domain-containing protein [Clostridiaceae bacterium]